MERYFTTPLYYVNARPHLGHAYTTIVADVVTRHYRQRSDKVTLLTGTDEHGEKIARMATQRGITPKALADEVSAEFKATWEKMNLAFDIFYRTTAPEHYSAVQAALTKLKDKGEIVFREYEGNYCVGCERFLTDTELTKDGTCPDHQTKPERRKEGNYFFLMSKYQKQLVEHFERNPKSIQPEHFRSEILSALKEPLGDLCISRPKERLTWGIEIPFDNKFVTYVWVDALMNYLAATGWPGKFNKPLWETATHLIGKDILKTHAVYWMSLLMALEVPPYRALQVGGYWLMSGAKMSKSLGNVVRPLDLEEKYGAETVRFYLLREMSYGLDAMFSLEGYINSINAYLANGIGNLTARTLTLCHKNFKGTVPTEGLTADDRALLDLRKKTVEDWDRGFSDLKFQQALKSWSELITACDLYINNNKPWALAKDPSQSDRLQIVLGTCLQAIQTAGVLIYPVLPQGSLKLCQALGIGDFDLGRNHPPLSLALESRKQYKLAPEVPKLFMRVSMPVEEQA